MTKSLGRNEIIGAFCTFYGEMTVVSLLNYP